MQRQDGLRDWEWDDEELIGNAANGFIRSREPRLTHRIRRIIRRIMSGAERTRSACARGSGVPPPITAPYALAARGVRMSRADRTIVRHQPQRDAVARLRATRGVVRVGAQRFGEPRAAGIAPSRTIKMACRACMNSRASRRPRKRPDNIVEIGPVISVISNKLDQRTDRSMQIVRSTPPPICQWRMNHAREYR